MPLKAERDLFFQVKEIQNPACCRSCWQGVAIWIKHSYLRPKTDDTEQRQPTFKHLLAYLLTMVNLITANSTSSLIFKSLYSHLNHFNEAQLEAFWCKNIAELYILNTKPYLTTGFAVNWIAALFSRIYLLAFSSQKTNYPFLKTDNKTDSALPATSVEFLTRQLAALVPGDWFICW